MLSHSRTARAVNVCLCLYHMQNINVAVDKQTLCFWNFEVTQSLSIIIQGIMSVNQSKTQTAPNETDVGS